MRDIQIFDARSGDAADVSAATPARFDQMLDDLGAPAGFPSCLKVVILNGEHTTLLGVTGDKVVLGVGVRDVPALSATAAVRLSISAARVLRFVILFETGAIQGMSSKEAHDDCRSRAYALDSSVFLSEDVLPQDAPSS